MAAARKDTQPHADVFSGFRATVPQLYANIDRTKVKSEDVAVTDVFQALQVYLGSLYINDFNYLGRTYRVVAQADAPFRAKPGGRAPAQDAQPGRATWSRWGAVLDVKDTVGPDRINRYNL